MSMSSVVIPPLKGNGSGVYRVRIVGNSGSGKIPEAQIMYPEHKSTLADELGGILNVPTIHLDHLYWNPGWVVTPVDEFQDRVSTTLASDACKRGWVVDGNYDRKLNGQLDGATDIIWLDTPFLLYFPRLLKRTFLRLFRLCAQCAPGCDEHVSETLFSRASILWWAITNHVPCQQREAARLRVDGVHVGGRTRRIGGWGRELREWKQAVVEMVKSI